MLNRSIIIDKTYTELPTPAILLDLEKLEYNINLMADFFKDKNCSIRPHIKSHKCITIAHMQVNKGAIGVTCAKTGEAEVMAQAGIKNILIANQVVEMNKLNVLTGLAKLSEIIMTVDNKKNCKDISYAARKRGVNIRILVELDVGLGRCGVKTIEEAVELTKYISSLDNVSFKGIMAYEGSFRGKSKEERSKIVNLRIKKAVKLKKILEKEGINVDVVSCGSTSTWDLTGSFPGVTEIQAGSYALMELPYIKDNLPFKPALTILSTVISKSENKIILDAGRKSITIDQGLPELINYSSPIIAMNEEHCIVKINDDIKNLEIGDKIKILPSHSCTTVNLHKNYYCIRKNKVESLWNINARGKVW